MTENKPRSCREEEHSKLMRFLNFKLPHSFRKVGLTMGALLMFGLIISKFADYYDLINKDFVRSCMLLALLAASISRERIEDEYTEHLRGRAYIFAFIFSVGYSTIMPLVAFVLDFLIVRITGDGQTSFYEVSSFEVMFMLICFQILIFEVLKRLDRAE